MEMMLDPSVLLKVCASPLLEGVCSNVHGIHGDAMGEAASPAFVECVPPPPSPVQVLELPGMHQGERRSSSFGHAAVGQEPRAAWQALLGLTQVRQEGSRPG